MTAAKIAALQRTAGNAAVSRMLGGGGRRPVSSSATEVLGRASILDDIKQAGGAAAEIGVDVAAAGDGKAADVAAAGGAALEAGIELAGAPGVFDGAETKGGDAGAEAKTADVAAALGGEAAVAGPDGGAEAKGAAEAVAEPAGADTKAVEGGPVSGGAEAKSAEGGAAAGGGPAADAGAPLAGGAAAPAVAAASGAGAAAGAAAGAVAEGLAEVVDTAATPDAKTTAPGAGAPGDAKGAAAASGGAAGAAPAGGEAKATAAPAAGGDAKAAAGPASGGEAKAAGGEAKVTAAPAAGGGAAAPAEVKVNKDPHADPAFNAMKGRSKGAAGGAKAHQPAKAGAASAQAAAEPPSNDAASQAQAAQVDEMSKKEPGTFDREAFIAAVKQAIEASAPKNLEEADDFKADGVKEQVSGQVKEGKEGSEKDIKDATVATPDSSKAKPKPVEPMKDDPVGQATPTVGASGAMPPPVPAAATDLSAGPDSIDAKMAEAQVTDEQIQKSNEPEFKGALDARDQAKEHSQQAPGEYRKEEKGVLGKASGDAAAVEGQGLQQMHGARGQAFAQAVGAKQGAKSADEAKRAKVASDLQSIYEKTKTDVTKTLDGLDGKVDAAFTQGEAQARKRFEDHVGQRMDAYKEDRYSGLLGKGRWLKDKLMGMPDEVNAFYAEGKTKYLADMDGVIGKIADIVGAGLTAARARIAQGKAEIAKYVQQLPQDLKKVGQEAEEKLSGQFEQLESDVESKQSEMVDTLARKYVESRDALDARIDEMKAANRGLVDKAMDAVVGVVKTIMQLKDMLLGVLAKAASVIGDIIADPIGFLGNLINGIKSGLSRFVGNIATHLQEGLLGWLTGALGSAGITMPKTFDLKGIFDLVLQILGLTYANIRSRVVKQVGEPVMARIEQTVDIFKILMTEGVGGLWNFVKDKIGDFEDMVLGQIKTFIIEKVIKAGITWLIAFMNPAAAFIKACKAIYDIVMFIIERGSEIMSFVNSILDSIAAVAKGNIGAMAERIEESLAKALPLAISFLASLLGLGGIADKVRSVIDKVRAPVTKAIDTVIMGAVKAAKKLFGKPAKWAKDKFDKGKKWAQDKAQSLKDRFTGKGKDKDAKEEETPEDVKRDAGREVEKRAPGMLPTEGALDDIVSAVEGEYRPKGLKSLEAVEEADRPGHYAILARNTGGSNVGNARAGGGKDYFVATDPDIAADMAAAGITSFGPFVWDSRVPRFKLEPATPNPHFGTYTLADCVDQPIYDAEKQTVAGERGNKRSLISMRRRAAMQQLFGITAGVIEKLLAHDEGKTPRPFVSLQAEDAVSGGHSAERHILGEGDMPTHRQVALRAAFQRVNGKLMALDAAGVASVFANGGAATTAVQAALNAELVPNWQSTHMAALAKGTQVKISASVGVPAVSYTKHDPPPGDPYPDSEMPKYIDGSKNGQRELFRGDYTSGPNPPDKAQPPLTTGGAMTQGTVYIIIDPSPSYPTGWAIYTAYPKP